MPLCQKLKSEITGIPADAFPKEEDGDSVIEPEIAPDCSNPKSPEFPVSEPSSVLPVASSTPVDQMSLLLSIEDRLKRLNDDILNLEQLISDDKAPDFYAVLDRIDAAQMSIETLLSAERSQPVPEVDNSRLAALLQAVLEQQRKNDRQLTQSLRDNTNFQIQVRQGMQHDLNKLKEQLDGEQFNPLLKEIALIFVEYQSLLDDEALSDRSRKNLQSLFEQLEDVLNDYGAEVHRSEIGSVRQNRICKIIEKIPTGHKEKHNTIAASRKPGVIRDRTVLYSEFVDVFVYDASLEEETNLDEIIDDEHVAGEAPIEKAADGAIDTPSNNNLGGNE